MTTGPSTPQTKPIKIAAAQISPVFLNKRATTRKVCKFIKDAGSYGVDMIGFPECCIPSYPAWGQIIPAESTPAQDFYVRLFHNSVEVPGPETEEISRACKDANVCAVVGVNERIAGSTGTIFNTLLFFDRTGELLLKHQKFVPTMGERLIHAPGQTGSAVSVKTDFGGVSGLICGENVNPLAVYSASLGYPLVHVASWPTHFDKDSSMLDGIATITNGLSITLGCFIVNAVAVDDDEAIEAYSACSHDREGTRRWLLAAREKSIATIIAPMGLPAVDSFGPGEGILTVDISMDAVVRSKFAFDVAGHYNRPEVFAPLFAKHL